MFLDHIKIGNFLLRPNRLFKSTSSAKSVAASSEYHHTISPSPSFHIISTSNPKQLILISQSKLFCKSSKFFVRNKGQISTIRTVHLLNAFNLFKDNCHDLGPLRFIMCFTNFPIGDPSLGFLSVEIFRLLKVKKRVKIYYSPANRKHETSFTILKLFYNLFNLFKIDLMKYKLTKSMKFEEKGGCFLVAECIFIHHSYHQYFESFSFFSS